MKKKALVLITTLLCVSCVLFVVRKSNNTTKVTLLSHFLLMPGKPKAIILDKQFSSINSDSYYSKTSWKPANGISIEKWLINKGCNWSRNSITPSLNDIPDGDVRWGFKKSNFSFSGRFSSRYIQDYQCYFYLDKSNPKSYTLYFKAVSYFN